MARCLLFRHVKALLGLLAFIGAGPAFASATLCSQSLLRDNFYVASLEAVARMKMNVDLAKADGVGATSYARKGLEKTFQSKYTELVEGLSKRFSKSAIDKLLKSHIDELQSKILPSEKLKDKDAREEQRRQINVGRFRLVEHVELPFLTYKSSDTLEVIAGTDSILVSNRNGEVILFDLKTRKYTAVRGKSGIVKSIPGTKQLVVIDEEVKIIDIKTQAIIQRIPLAAKLNFAEGFTKSTFDPTGRFLVFNISKNELMVLDMQSHKISRHAHVNEIGSLIYQIMFINEREILISSAVDGRKDLDFALLDIQQGKARVLPGTKSASNFRLVQNNQKILVDYLQPEDGVTEHGIFDVKNMQAPPLKLKRQHNAQTLLSVYKTIPETDYVALEALSDINIYRIEDLTRPIFDFDSHYIGTGVEIVDHAYAPNGESAIIVYTDANYEIRNIDYWRFANESQ
jgi:hypothetical protein